MLPDMPHREGAPPAGTDDVVCGRCYTNAGRLSAVAKATLIAKVQAASTHAAIRAAVMAVLGKIARPGAADWNSRAKPHLGLVRANSNRPVSDAAS